MSDTVIDLYRAAVAAQPGNGAIRAGLAQALLAAGRGSDALAEADEALMASPRLADAWQVRGQALGALGRLAEAAGAWESALDADPERAGLCVNLGILCARLDRVADAEHWLRRAIHLDASLKEAHASLGALYACTGRPDLAEERCLEALRLDPGLVAAHQNLAALADARGDRAAALRHWGAAFARQSVFVEPAYDPACDSARNLGAARTVLVPLVAGGGNVPIRHLLPRSRNTLVKWCIEHAKPGEAERLPDCDLVFNAIGDPDEGVAAEAALAAFLRGCGRTVLNPPERVATTRRDRLPGLLGGLPGVVAPAVVRVPRGERPGEAAARAGLVLPVLLRAAGAHGGEGVTLLRTADDLAAVPAAAVDGYLTAFHDYRSADGLWRKHRAIFVAGEAFAYHLAAGERWLVHYWTAGMEHHPGRLDEERRFLADPARALGAATWDAVRAIGRRIGLDWCGLDFARLGDGRVLVFEANATMSVHPEPDDGPLAHKNPAVRAILDAFDATLERARSGRRTRVAA